MYTPSLIKAPFLKIYILFALLIFPDSTLIPGMFNTYICDPFLALIGNTSAVRALPF